MTDRVRCFGVLLAAALRCPARDGPHTAAVALCTEFTPEPCAVAAAFRPATGEVGLDVLRHCGVVGLVVRRRPAGFQPAIDRGHARANGTADCMTRQTQLMQPQHFLIAELAAISSVRPQAFLARNLRRYGRRWGGSLLRHGARSLTDSTAVTIHTALHGLAEIAEEVPSIRYLHGVRCALPGGISIGAGTVTGDNLDPVVTPQPGRKRVGLAVGQKVDDLVAFQVDQDGPVVLAAPPRPVIDSQHAGRRRQGHHRAVNQTQQGIRAAGMVSRPASRAPASPPRAKPSWHWMLPSRAVRRAERAEAAPAARQRSDADSRDCRSESGVPGPGHGRTPLPGRSISRR